MTKESLTTPILLVAGISLAAVGFGGIHTGEAPLHSRNTFAIQGSAYGKLLARLSETTIDRVWHLGVEQIVPHYMSGEEAHDDGSPFLPANADRGAAQELVPSNTSDPNLVERSKKWLHDRVIAQYTRTNPYAMGEQHLHTVYKDIEKMLLRSFKLDPTHYGAYDSYHLFLTTTNFGGSPAAYKHAEVVANAVISNVFSEKEDPEPWLTAAAAAMNLFNMASAPYIEEGVPLPLELLNEYQNKIGYCLARFDQIQQESEKSGNWERLSFERQMEITGRVTFAKRFFNQFEVLIARAESRNEQAGPEGEVAEKAVPQEN